MLRKVLSVLAVGVCAMLFSSSNIIAYTCQVCGCKDGPDCPCSSTTDGSSGSGGRTVFNPDGFTLITGARETSNPFVISSSSRDDITAPLLDAYIALLPKAGF